MSNVPLKVVRLPENWMIFTNYMYMNSTDLTKLNLRNRYLGVLSRIYCVESHAAVPSGCIAMSQPQRSQLNVELEKYVYVSPPEVELQNLLLNNVTLTVAISKPQRTVIDCTKLDEEVKIMFSGQVLDDGFNLYHRYDKSISIFLTVSEIGRGVITRNTNIVFKPFDKGVVLKNNMGAKKMANGALLNIDFEKLGIGGLDKEFNDIFRRAFVSRVLPHRVVEKLGIKHVRGMIMYGPPGCGKTLIARQISKSLKSVEPKIVSGPEILSKWVGESEENIRKLFADAEKDQASHGDSSELHVIIFDEIDAICKKRGKGDHGNARVGDSVVNQLLAKIDGVDSLNNILLIGMTNRLDMLDPALLRPGRFEVHVEISLPDQTGRLQILNIHTKKMRTTGCLSGNVDLMSIAEQTKNFTGAELEGIVKSAVSFAAHKHIKGITDEKVSLDEIENTDKVVVTADDFEFAIGEIKPAFGVHDIEELKLLQENGVLIFNRDMKMIIDTVNNRLNLIKSPDTRTRLSTVLLYGENGAGKTTLLANLACNANMDYTKMIRADALLGMTEVEKASYIKDVFEESYKSKLSLILIDDVERIIEYVNVGPRFSNLILQTLLVLINREPPVSNHRLMVACATSEYPFMKVVSFDSLFHVVERIPLVSGADEWSAISTSLYGDEKIVHNIPNHPVPIKKVIINL